MQLSCVLLSGVLFLLATTPGSGANFTTHTPESNASSMRGARAELVSFHSFGKNINVGLDFIFPFLRVPLQRKVDQYGNEPALVNINTASLVLTGLITTAGLIVGHVFRNFGMHGRADDTAENSESSNEGARKKRLFDTDDEQRLMDLLAPFKLIYKNETGERVETTLPNLMTTIEQTFLENNINLPACVQKSICSLVHRASSDVRSGRASSYQKIIDGMSHLSWLVEALHQQSPLREAIDAGKRALCDAKYPMCKWPAPEEKLGKLIDASINFV